jgi:hypothetical protein
MWSLDGVTHRGLVPACFTQFKKHHNLTCAQQCSPSGVYSPHLFHILKLRIVFPAHIIKLDDTGYYLNAARLYKYNLPYQYILHCHVIT